MRRSKNISLFETESQRDLQREWREREEVFSLRSPCAYSMAPMAEPFTTRRYHWDSGQKTEEVASAFALVGLSNSGLRRVLLSKELQRQAWQLIRLRENRRTCLLQDAQSSQIRGFFRYVHVSNSTLSGHKILSCHSKVRNSGRES
jgi:hypothetical protein